MLEQLGLTPYYCAENCRDLSLLKFFIVTRHIGSHEDEVVWPPNPFFYMSQLSAIWTFL